MITNALEPGARTVVVVGGGPSGVLAALELVRRGIDVTVLDSGLHLHLGFLARAAGHDLVRVVRFPAASLSWPLAAGGDAVWTRALVPGGLSNFWTGAVPRYSAEDFRACARDGEATTWPLTYAELVPYYQQVERLLHVAGGTDDLPTLPAAVLLREVRLPRAWRGLVARAAALGRALVPLPLAGEATWALRPAATGFDAISHLLPLLLESRRCRWRFGAHVLRVATPPARERRVEVTYLDRRTGRESTLRAAAVVLAAGPLATTQVLLSSLAADGLPGIDGAGEHVGRYLHDHPLRTVRAHGLPDLPQAPGGAYLTRRAYDDARAERPVGCQVYARGLLGRLPRPFRRTARFLHPEQSVDATLEALCFGTLRPRPENRVTLDPDHVDALGVPLLRVACTLDDEARRALDGAVDDVRALFDALPGRARVEVGPIRPPGTSVHLAGTARMHRSPRYGVVDGLNRVHGCPRVLVVDASCFTGSVEKNPTLTVMALAARAAATLASDLRAARL